ncbi:MAG TPA: IS1182 family transposase, partial [Thermoanaerobaculia bacterium]|nr:IS1182 family transposase [Thermoanaerobaculia bacterium]
MTIDELLEPDHPARAVWSYVERLDLTPLYDRIRARGHSAGRPAIDPRLLVALWLYATLAGFTSARELADLCLRHDASRWLAGGVSVNYHTLADFRTDHPAVVEQLLKQSVEVLRQQGLIDLDRIAQDGMRVRADAGAASFHRRATLERQLEEARAELRELRRKRATNAAHPASIPGVAAEGPPADEPDLSPREAAAMRHAEGRVERVERALDRMPEMEAKIEPGEKKEARVSTTDPQATVMKMADGGFRPAYNVEYATTCDGQVVVGVDVVTVGSDHGRMRPMLDQIEGRFERRPKEVLVDGGFVDLEDIEGVQSGGECKVFAPVAKPRKDTVDRHEPKATDSEGVAGWRRRMGTEEAKEIYKERAATAECVNALARNRGLRHLMVRGLEKVKSVATWFAITQNMA